MERLVRSQPGKITFQLRDGDGNLVDASSDVTVTVTNAVGSPVATSSAARESLGTYALQLTAAHNAVLDTYTDVCTATVAGQDFSVTTQHEVVGAHLFGIGAFRALDKMLTASAYPADRVRKARDEATDQLERTGTTFGSLRGCRVTLDGSGADTLRIPHTLVRTVISCTVDGQAVSPSAIHAYADQRLVLASGSWGTGNRSVVLHYEAGWQSVPQPLARAAMILARDAVVPGTDAGSLRATAAITEQIAYRLSMPGPGAPTGIPIVDEAIREYLFPNGRR